MNRRDGFRLVAGLWLGGLPLTQVLAAAPAVRLPDTHKLAFQVHGQAKGMPYRAEAELVWSHDGTRYQARQTVRAFLLGERTQTSEGHLTPQGLTPERFTDTRRNKVRTATLSGQGITFSTGAPTAPWEAGTQDRLSVFVQLGALLAMQPDLPQGTVFRFPTAGMQDVEPWAFVLHETQTLQLPVGTVPTVRLERQPRKPNDQQAEIWLAPQWGYLPARIRLLEHNGDAVDLRLLRITP